MCKLIFGAALLLSVGAGPPVETAPPEQLAKIRLEVIACLQRLKDQFQEAAQENSNYDPRYPIVIAYSSDDHKTRFQLRDQALEGGRKINLGSFNQLVEPHMGQPETRADWIMARLYYANKVTTERLPPRPDERPGEASYKSSIDPDGLRIEVSIGFGTIGSPWNHLVRLGENHPGLRSLAAILSMSDSTPQRDRTSIKKALVPIYQAEMKSLQKRIDQIVAEQP